jgi:hypothetical protein
VPDGVGDGGPVGLVFALAVVEAGVDLELDGGGRAVEELGEDGFKVFDCFLEWHQYQDQGREESIGYGREHVGMGKGRRDGRGDDTNEPVPRPRADCCLSGEQREPPIQDECGQVRRKGEASGRRRKRLGGRRRSGRRRRVGCYLIRLVVFVGRIGAAVVLFEDLGMAG